MTETTTPPHYPGADHERQYHSGQGGDWRSPLTLNGHVCDYTVHRLLALALADSVGIRAPQEFAVLHGAAYDLVHDQQLEDELAARQRLVELIERMRGPVAT
ncbi:MAG: hypothetical protein LC721_12535 [Actinobacteria bacterium]|nr:hypothetical protein [Actinomycetota bacterium]